MEHISNPQFNYISNPQFNIWNISYITSQYGTYCPITFSSSLASLLVRHTDNKVVSHLIVFSQLELKYKVNSYSNVKNSPYTNTNSDVLPYLPLYNAHPWCIMRTPILDCTLKKKEKRSRKQSKWLRKNSVKTSWFGNTLNTTLDHLFRNVTRCTGHKTISPSDGLFWWSASLKSWIPATIHCIELLV